MILVGDHGLASRGPLCSIFVPWDVRMREYFNGGLKKHPRSGRIKNGMKLTMERNKT